MKIITLASQKGGVGKSTISIHLATAFSDAGKSVVLADLDPYSKTSTQWASCRMSEKPMVVRVNPRDLSSLVGAVREDGANLLFLDLPPYVDDTTIEAAKMANLVLIPARPSFPDLRSLPDVMTRVGKHHTVLLNACYPGLASFENTKTMEARRVLEENDISVCPVSIAQRVAFTDALNGGQAVCEFEKKSKAALEIKRLTQWVATKLEIKIGG